MSSGFVSGGTNEAPTERDDAWRKAQAELDAKNLAKAEAKNQQEGKSLYETLQANKAAKQEAFEESTKLRNQFRSLDEDEVEFLDSVLESTRAKEAEVRKQTSESLETFREQQREAERGATQQDAEPEVEVAEVWTAGPRKRKKGKEGMIGGVKLRRVSTSEKQATSSASNDAEEEQPGKAISPQAEEKSKPGGSSKDATAQTAIESQEASKEEAKASPPKPSSRPAGGLGLGAYSSDENND